MSEILGLDSAIDAAKEAGTNNMMISAPLIIEMGDRIKDLEKDRNRCLVMALKWCHRRHYDWQELLQLADK